MVILLRQFSIARPLAPPPAQVCASDEASSALDDQVPRESYRWPWAAGSRFCLFNTSVMARSSHHSGQIHRIGLKQQGWEEGTHELSNCTQSLKIALHNTADIELPLTFCDDASTRSEENRLLAKGNPRDVDTT